MRVLGIDPSLTSTGLALVEAGEVLRVERVRSKRKGHDRIEEILGAVEQQIWGGGRKHAMGYEPTGNSCEDEDPPDSFVVGIEGPAMGAKGSSVVQIFGLWGIITHRLWQWGVPYYVVPPSTLKKYATGLGNASKDEVLARVVRDHPSADVTGNDVADALVIAAIGAHRAGEPLIAPTAYQTQALEKVQWGSNE